MKSTYVFGALVAFALSQSAFAVSFNARCEFSIQDKSFELHAIIVQQLGTPAEKLGVAISTLTLVDSLEKNLVFNDNLSRLNTVKSSNKGIYEVVSKAIYPIRSRSDFDHPKAEYHDVRHLVLNAAFKAKNAEDRALRLEKLSLDVTQEMTKDTTFLGKATATIDGVEYPSMNTKCLVYVSMENAQ